MTATFPNAPPRARSHQQQFHRDRPHGESNQHIEYLPTARLCKQWRQQACTVAEAEKEDKAGRNSADTERQPILVLRRDRPQQDHGIKINMRVEPGQCQQRQDRVVQTTTRPPVGGKSFAPSPRRQRVLPPRALQTRPPPLRSTKRPTRRRSRRPKKHAAVSGLAARQTHSALR